MINTWKHAGRRSSLTRGRVAHDHGHPGGTRAIELEFIAPGRAPRSRDVLELLQACLDSWAGYLASEGISVEWPPRSPWATAEDEDRVHVRVVAAKRL